MESSFVVGNVLAKLQDLHSKPHLVQCVTALLQHLGILHMAQQSALFFVVMLHQFMLNVF